MNNVESLSTKEREIVVGLIRKFGENTTLKGLLEIKDKTPIENVKFHITGTYVYAYECTGEQGSWKGTIKDILEELDSWKMFKEPEAKISELITEEELTDLAKFFLGQRDDRCLDNVEVDISREVTLEEIKNYIGNIEVWKRFNYETTLIDF